MKKVLVCLVLVLSFMTVGCGGKESAEPPVTHTAVVCGSYWIAFGLMNMLRDYGVRVPEDLSVVCCDNFFHTEYLDITTTKFDKIENGIYK